MAAHTCFADADILMNDDITSMVNQAVSQDLTVSSDFDAYMDVFCSETGNGDMNII